MKEERTQHISYTTETLVAIICNKCGKRMTEEEDNVEWQELFTFDFECGYGSVFGAGSEWEIDLCQNCLKEVLGPYMKERG
jgi:hypothetical protein